MEQLTLMQHSEDIEKEREDLKKFYFKGEDMINYIFDDNNERIPVKLSMTMFIQRVANTEKKNKTKVFYVINCFWGYKTLDDKIIEGYDDLVENSFENKTKEEAIEQFEQEKEMFEFQRDKKVVFDGHRYFWKWEIENGIFEFKEHIW